MDIHPMRWTVLLLCLLARPDARGAAQPSPSDQPAFRSGVELVTVDVGVIDGNGRPVRGLGPTDFTVTVGGQRRRIVSAEFIDAGGQPPEPAAGSDVVPVSTNEGNVGRLVIFVVDNNTLDVGDARRVAADASRLLSKLRLSDRSALVPLPIGRSIPFTWAHERVGEALLRAATAGGATASFSAWEFGNLSEARDIATRGSFALREVAARECLGSLGASTSGLAMDPDRPSSTASPGQSPPSGGNPQGGQGSGSSGSSGGSAPRGGSSQGSSISTDFAQDRCLREIQSEAEMAWSVARSNSLTSVTALRQLLSKLASVQGDKTLVLISGGWPLDEHDETSLMTTLAADAAAARVKVFPIFVPRSPVSASRRTISMSTRDDRSLFSWPLENLAGMTGARAFRAEVGAEGIFERLADELAGYYRVGVEKNASDAGATGRPMKVKVARAGVTVRARDIFDVATYEDRDWAARLAAALDAPVPATAIGLRVTTYLSADPEDPTSIRILFAGEASRFQPGTASLQVVVRDLEGRRIIAGEQRLGEFAGTAARFATHVGVPHGSYMVRLAIQDGAGRVGSIDRRVDARSLPLGPLGVTGPTFVQASATGQREPQLALDGIRPDERLALEVEFEGERAHLANTDVVFEIAADRDGPALIQVPASLAQGRRDTFMAAQAVVDVRVLPPGDYLARAKVTSGAEPLGEVRRAFAILQLPARTADEAAAASAGLTSGSTELATSIRGRAVATLPRFAIRHVLAADVLNGFLDRVAARPDAAFPGVGALVSRARAGEVSALEVSDAQAAQTPTAAFIQGVTLLAQNQPTPAARAFRTAMRASPDFYPAMVYLGACYAAVGNDKEASAVWRTALIREGATPTVHLLLSDALLRQGNGDLALQVVNAARARWPEDEELNRRFVQASLLAGHVAPGLQALEGFLERGTADEPSLTLALLVLYDSLAHGRTIEGLEPDRARMIRLADAYRARGGASVPLIETWVAAVSGKKGQPRP